MREVGPHRRKGQLLHRRCCKSRFHFSYTFHKWNKKKQKEGREKWSCSIRHKIQEIFLPAPGPSHLIISTHILGQMLSFLHNILLLTHYCPFVCLYILYTMFCTEFSHFWQPRPLVPLMYCHLINTTLPPFCTSHAQTKILAITQ